MRYGVCNSMRRGRSGPAGNSGATAAASHHHHHQRIPHHHHLGQQIVLSSCPSRNGVWRAPLACASRHTPKPDEGDTSSCCLNHLPPSPFSTPSTVRRLWPASPSAYVCVHTNGMGTSQQEKPWLGTPKREGGISVYTGVALNSALLVLDGPGFVMLPNGDVPRHSGFSRLFKPKNLMFSFGPLLPPRYCRGGLVFLRPQSTIPISPLYTIQAMPPARTAT
jgi:hypothetical protein